MVTGLAKIGMALRSHAWRSAAAQGLTPTQGEVLALLVAGDRGGLRLGELARQLGVRAPTASEAVSALARKALVVKSADPADARAVRVLLTDSGREEAARVASWPEFLMQAVGALSEAERVVFLRALVTMIRELQNSGRIPVARMCVSCTFFRPHVHPDPRRPHHCAFVDAPFGDGELRVDCPEQDPLSDRDALALWERYAHPGLPSDATPN